MSATPYKFDLPVHHKSIIKVIGVGGGGSNAVNHMFNQGIKDVEFVICNTDVQALKSSPVPTKLQIGVSLTEGLGAGANPEVGRNAAIESKEDIREFLSDGTKMVFITAGMGGGTGTGAAPVIAKIARDLDILTVGIVTLPFKFEGKNKLKAAKSGIDELKQFCDTVLVIVNDKLFEMHHDLPISQGWFMADNVLTTAAKSIAEIITVTSHVNVDFEDVKTVMKNSGAAVMGSAFATGENRAKKAVEEAICSPLLDNTDILGAKKILLSLSSGDQAELTMRELNEITAYIEERAGDDAEMIWGQGIDSTLGESIRVTIIATGFDHNYEKPDFNSQKKIFDLERDAKPVKSEPVKPEPRDIYMYEKPQERTFEKPVERPVQEQRPAEPRDSYIYAVPQKREEPAQYEAPRYEAPKTPEPPKVEKIVRPLFDTEEEKTFLNQEEEKPYIRPAQVTPQAQFDFVNEMEEKKKLLQQQSMDRINRLKNLSTPMDVNPSEFKEKLEVPAYLRRNVSLPEHPHSSEKKISRYNLNDDNEILGNNKFLHDNVD
jgi:cell division protein FtsZ